MRRSASRPPGSGSTSDAGTAVPQTRGYHHGDLRQALVAEGLRLLERDDAQTLSLREIARGVGVSPTSVYRHFPSKEALLAALAQRGLIDLASSQREAAKPQADLAAGFAATGRAYVRFALAHPALFRLIFTSPSLLSGEAGSLASEPGQLLRHHAAAQAAINGGDPTIAAIKAWAQAHGLAMLLLDGQLKVELALIERAIA